MLASSCGETVTFGEASGKQKAKIESDECTQDFEGVGDGAVTLTLLRIRSTKLPRSKSLR